MFVQAVRIAGSVETLVMRAHPSGITTQTGDRADHSFAHCSVTFDQRHGSGVERFVSVQCALRQRDFANVEETTRNRDVMNLIGIKPEVLGDAPGKGAHTREMRQECRIGNPNHLMHCIYQVLGRSPADDGLFRNDVVRAFAQGIQTS